MTAALLVVGLASLAAVVAIAWPLVARAPATDPAEPLDDDRREVEEELERALAAIREIAQDHRAGHLSDEDFAALDRDERARAVELMRRRDQLRA